MESIIMSAPSTKRRRAEEDLEFEQEVHSSRKGSKIKRVKRRQVEPSESDRESVEETEGSKSSGKIGSGQIQLDSSPGSSSEDEAQKERRRKIARGKKRAIGTIQKPAPWRQPHAAQSSSTQFQPSPELNSPPCTHCVRRGTKCEVQHAAARLRSVKPVTCLPCKNRKVKCSLVPPASSLSNASNRTTKDSDIAELRRDIKANTKKLDKVLAMLSRIRDSGEVVDFFWSIVKSVKGDRESSEIEDD
ncbi:hypothetical protein GYMLUDRAFT_101201 [Collybiopsis luxurians FD-317 M1]|uniref:Zn(2)-C6 fungal-type domain-containing protein n=1 Tax=Collybiopsis luxurians FD-317 M1 TaxID=944289 RepID=A0A0D0BNB9_9AGAR|nr:hypothetical protein GYMLUDRAFT_101201 [Collybiopsis luxurians FD-317 M1]